MLALLAFLALVATLAAAVLIGALTSTALPTLPVVIGAAAVVTAVVPLLAAVKVTGLLKKVRRPVATLGTILVWNGALVGAALGGMPEITASAMTAHGDWFLPASTPEAVRVGYTDLIGKEPPAEEPVEAPEEPPVEGAAEIPEEPPAAAPVAAEEPLSASALFTARADTVVVIKTQAPLPEDDHFSDLYREMGVKLAEGAGSGFLVSADGVFVTNHHVLGGATRAEVALRDGRTFSSVEVLVTDPTNDLVLAKIDATDLPHAPLAEESGVVGAQAYAIGSPLGLEYSLTQGIVSAHRDMQGTAFLQMQTDIAPGSSGGPLFNDRGAVMGVNTATRYPGLNLAVDIRYVHALLEAPRQSTVLQAYEPGMTVGALEQVGIALEPVARQQVEHLIQLAGRRVDFCLGTLPEGVEPPAASALDIYLGDRSMQIGGDLQSCVADGGMMQLLFMAMSPTLFAEEDGHVSAAVDNLTGGATLTVTIHPGAQPEAPAEVEEPTEEAPAEGE